MDFYWQSEGQYYHDIGEVDLTNKYQSTILHTIEPRVSGSRIAAAQTGPGLQVFTVSGNPAGYGGQEPVRFTVVDVETQRAVYSKDMTEPGPQKDFSSFGLAVSSDGKEVYITGADLTGKKNYTYLWVYDTAKKKMKPNRLELGLNTGYDWHVSAAPAGIDKLYVSGTDTKGYTIVNTKTLEIEDTTEVPYFGPMFGFYPAQDNS